MIRNEEQFKHAKSVGIGGRSRHQSACAYDRFAGDGTILVDCCTCGYRTILASAIPATTALIAAHMRNRNVLVSNEVGSGIVPETKLGRDSREQGRLNQRLAEIADTVELVVAGIPLRLKG